jgi:hypothetical protein
MSNPTRQARVAFGRDADIDRALRRKASKGDVAAARELRERARVKLDVATETMPRVVLEDMSNEELERLREGPLRMAVRMNERAARAQPGWRGRHPFARRSPGPDVGTSTAAGSLQTTVDP